MRTLILGLALASVIATAFVACDSKTGKVGDNSSNSDNSGSSEAETVTELTEPRNALTEELMVALAQAKNFHHKADVHLKDAQLDLAIDSVRQILEIPFPADTAETSDVILDARARLAKLLITKGDLDAAMETANLGLESSERESFFLANLFTVRGHVWEARAQRADEAKDTDGGKQARRNALVDFDRSISINKAVLKRIAGASAK